MTVLEKTIEKTLVKGIEMLGGRCYKLYEDGRRGFPDRTIVLPWYVGFVETKTPKGKLKPQQEQRIEEIKKAGGKVCVLFSETQVIDFLAYLKRIKNETTTAIEAEQ